MSEPLTPQSALKFWREALKHELGIKLPISQPDLDKVKATMYAARKAAADPALEELRLIVAPGGTEVWIMKKTTELP